MTSLGLRVAGVGKAGSFQSRASAEYEARLGLASLPERGRSFALTREGERLDTRGLADELGDIAGYGPGGATLLFGGAYGPSASALAATDRRIWPSDLTPPHELARLVLAEQLYRAGTILRGKPYHKGG